MEIDQRGENVLIEKFTVNKISIVENRKYLLL